MTNELYITAPLDQELPADIEDALDHIDVILEYSIQQKDPNVVYGYCVSTLTDFKIKGLSLAKALYGLERQWDQYELGDNFLDTTTAMLGLHRHTIERYCKIWKMLKEDAPAEVVPVLQQLGLNSLIPIANAVSQGLDLEPQHWQELANAPDKNTIDKLIKEYTGREDRSNKLSIMIDREGSLWAVNGKNMWFIGSLEVNDKDETIKKAINRIIERSGIIQR